MKKVTIPNAVINEMFNDARVRFDAALAKIERGEDSTEIVEALYYEVTNYVISDHLKSD